MARKGRARRFREARALKQGAFAGESDFESILGEDDPFDLSTRSSSDDEEDDEEEETEDPYAQYADDPYAEYYAESESKDS